MYYFNEGSLAIPAQWQDKTVHILTTTSKEADGFSFTISRDEIPWGMTFAEFFERETSTLSRQLTNYQQIDQETGEIATLATASSEFSWDSPEGTIHQYMTFVDSKPHVLIFTGTMVGMLSAQQKEKVKAILQTLTLNPPQASSEEK